MNSSDKLLDISSRIQHLSETAEWIARETVHSDNSLSQSGTLITVLAEDIRGRIYDLVNELEKALAETKNVKEQGYH